MVEKIKIYSWNQIVKEPGVYQPLEIDGFYLVVFKNTDDYGEYAEPEVVMVYNRKLKTFYYLGPIHWWSVQFFTKSTAELMMVEESSMEF